ncbi:MAG TPA: hypothetical protein VH684_28585, partial [Xanthobacteraceae bacterium]
MLDRLLIIARELHRPELVGKLYPSGLGRLADPFAREMMCPLTCELKGTHGHDDNSFGSRAPAALDGC